MSTVWPEILARRYFGGLLKICHLAEFTLAVEPVSSHNDFITKWLIERTGNHNDFITKWLIERTGN